MRKPIALLFAAALVLGMAGMANAVTYTWSLVEGPAVALLWPNEAGSPNIFEADGGLLGRIIAQTDPGIANVCELAPSYGCAAGSPPIFLLPTGSAEGPVNAGGSAECNRKVIACNTGGIPGAAHGGHLANQDSIGEYSYFVIHTVGGGTTPPGKGVAFFSGGFVQQSDPYTCNDCPPAGRGRDENVAGALNNTITQSTITTLSVSLWTTQSTGTLGHSSIRLDSPNDGVGSSSVCGNGLAFQDLIVDLCSDGFGAPPGGNFDIADQKVNFGIYSVDMAQHASFTSPGRCNPPDCYIQNVLIPAATTQDAAAKNIQVQVATSVLQAPQVPILNNATVDSLIFAYTTQLIDMDGDTTEDRLDPCPNDPADGCVADLINGGNCPAGQVFCVNATGSLGCLDSYLCNVRLDANQDCVVDGGDFNAVNGSADGIQGDEVFASGLPVGPFDP